MSNAFFGKIDSILTFRLLPGMDIMDSIQKHCQDKNVKNGVILSMMGSVRGAKFLNPEPNEQSRMGYLYGEPIIMPDIVELVMATGFICHSEKDEILLHVHAVFSDKDGNAFGGHLIPGNEVLITTDVVIGVISDVDMLRSLDEQVGLMAYAPRQSLTR